MSTNIKLKRSAVQGKVPATTDLDLGELAINTFDGKLYMKKDDGVETIVDITSAVTPVDIQSFTYDSANGVLTIEESDSTIFTANLDLDAFSTTDLSEGTNLYFTTARANTAIDNRVTKTFVDALNVDANTLDGQQGTYYLDWTNVTNKPDPTVTLTGAVTGSATMTDLGSISITTTATSDPTLTLTGDVSGTATFTNLGNATLTATIADDSHNHIISNIDGLQTELDGKADDTTTISAGAGLTGGGSLAANSTISHADTSTQASLTALTGANVISDIDLDTYGHVTNLATRSLTLANLGYTGDTNAQVNQNAFSNIAVSGQTTIAADTTTDTLTFIAGSNITITTNATSDSVTIDAEGTSIVNDTTTNATRYLAFTDQTSGSESTFNVSSTKLYFNPSTGQLNATDFNALSDKKLKSNIITIENPIDKVIALRGVNFDWSETGNKSMGVIAQEVEEIIPEVVNGNETKSVNYNGMVGLLVEAIKEQQKQIEDLKTRINKNS